MIRTQKLATQIASCFGVGHLPVAPGTWASMYTAAVAFLIQFYLGLTGLLVFFIAACLLSIWSVEMILRSDSSDKDPSWVVIDEVAGQSFVFFYMFDNQWWLAIIGFLAFRLFDILKPWPISWIDRKFQNSFGVLADDLAAGVLAGLAIFLFQIGGF